MARAMPTGESVLDALTDIAWPEVRPGFHVMRSDGVLAVWWTEERGLVCAYVRTPEAVGFTCTVPNGREVTPELLTEQGVALFTPRLSERRPLDGARPDGWHALREVLSGLDAPATLASVLAQAYVAEEHLASDLPHARRMQEFAVAQPWLFALGIHLSPDRLREAVSRDGDGAVAMALLREVRGRDDGDGLAAFLMATFAGDNAVDRPTAGSLEVLAALPRDFVAGAAWHPPGDASDYAHAVAALAQATGRRPRETLGHVPREGYGRWLRRRAGRQGEGATLRTALSGLNSMLEAFTNEVLQTARAAMGVPQAPDPRSAHRHMDEGDHGLPVLAANFRIWAGPAARILARDATFPALLEASARWHARATGIGRAVESMSLDKGRAAVPLTPDVDLGGNVYLTCLADAAALSAEGAEGPDADGVPGLDHCVSSYLPQVLSGHAHVLSLRRRLPGGRWERLSTVEVARVRDGLGVVQHAGRRNASPDPALAERVRAWLDREGPALAAALPPPKGSGPLGASARAVAEDPSRWDALRDAWAFALPRPLRSAGPAEVLAYGGERA